MCELAWISYTVGRWCANYRAAHGCGSYFPAAMSGGLHDQGSFFEIDVNVSPTFVPVVSTAVMIATAMSAAISAYSSAVTPSSLLCKRPTKVWKYFVIVLFLRVDRAVAAGGYRRFHQARLRDTVSRSAPTSDAERGAC